jgi:hypothetical protein
VSEDAIAVIETNAHASKMIKLQIRISERVKGFVHVQTNPYHSYDTEKMVEDARSRSTDFLPVFKIGKRELSIENMSPYVRDLET